jgi:AcrR family transcriptional regulator
VVLTIGQEAVDRRSTRLVVVRARKPRYTRLVHDERRAELLELGARLFTERAYDELSMAKIAREAGISKALLYHYFPSKQAFFVATLSEGAEELRRRVEPDPERPAGEALVASLDAYLAWIEERRESYLALLRSATGVPEVRELVDDVRSATATRIVDGLSQAAGRDVATPAVRAGVRGWLWFMDGAISDWLEHDDLRRDELLGLLLGTLLGTLTAAGAADVAQVAAGA